MPGIDREAAVEIQRRAFDDFVALLGSAAPGSRLVDLDGVRAAAVPAAPERSIVNSVTYRDPEALAANLELLASIEAEAGVRAWTVWATEEDGRAIEVLEAAGHAFDGRPAAMVLELDDFAPPELGDLDWDAGASYELLGRLNDEAYGPMNGGGIAAALAREPTAAPLPRLYQARLDGEPASVLATIDHAPGPGAAGPDCGVYWVATPERFRRRGLATRLLGAVLAEARERGCATSSLQASSMGAPVYESLGYRPHFRFAMYERRA